MPSQLVIVRTAVCLLALAMSVLMFGPFQGLENALGLTDKAAHGTAFYLLTIGLYACFPRNRRTDLGLIVIAIGGGAEIVQMAVGRDGNLPDFAADCVGILAAMLPATVERMRISMRQRGASSSTRAA